MRSAVLAVGMVALLLPAGPAAADMVEDAACVTAHIWTTKLMRRAGLPEYVQGWRCDVIEDLGDGTWRVAGVYGRRDLKTTEPFIARLFGPFLGRLFGYCEIIVAGRLLADDGPERECGGQAFDPRQPDRPA